MGVRNRVVVWLPLLYVAVAFPSAPAGARCESVMRGYGEKAFDERDPVDPPPPDTGGGTPTPPDTGGGTPTPPDGGSGGPSKGGGGPSKGGGGPSTGGGTRGTKTPAASADPRARRKGGESEELVYWQQWWRVHEDRYLRVRSRVRDFEAKAITAAHDGPAPAPASGAVEAAARELLLESLKDREWTVRSAAAIAAGRSGTMKAFHAFLKLATDRKRDVRRSAGIALGLLKDPIADSELGNLLFDPTEEDELREVAALSLGLTGGEEAAAILLRYFDPATEALRQGGIHRTSVLDETVVRALGMTGHAPAAASLRTIAADGDADVRSRAAAIDALAKLGDAGSLPLLVQALHCDEEILRRAAAAAMGTTAKPADLSAVAALAKAAQDDGDISTRRYAVLSLGMVGGNAAAEALPRILGLAATDDRPFAALGLGLGGVKDAAPALRAMLRKEPNPAVRAAFAIALGLLGDKEAGPDLVAGVRGEALPETRVHYLTALTLAGHPEVPKLAREFLSKDELEFDLIRVGLCLAVAGERDGIEAVEKLTKDGCCQTCRSEAAHMLGRIGSPTALPHLMALAREDSEILVRSEAIWAIGRILDRSEFSAFQRLGMDTPFPALRGPMRAAMSL
jgi:HEAT repeat protein